MSRVRLLIPLSIALLLGVIVVSNSENLPFQKSEFENCQNSPGSGEKIQCWEKMLTAELGANGLEAAFELFKNLYASDQEFANECHAFTHLLGTEAYRLFEKNEDFSIPATVAFCNYGFYHGFTETLVTSGGNLDKARDFCEYIDTKLSAQYPESPEQCYHGIGHGNAGVHDERLWGDTEAVIAQGLEICERVANSDERLYRCTSGVYNAISDFHKGGDFGFSMDMINPDDPLRLCREQPEKYRESCYGNMKSVVSAITGGDFAKVAAITERIPDKHNAETTIWYFAGYNMNTKLYLDDYSKDISVCREMSVNLRLPCIKGLATGFLWYSTPEQEYLGALRFCAQDLLSAEESRACFQEIIPRLSFYYSYEKVMEICEMELVPAIWKDMCRTKQLNPPR